MAGAKIFASQSPKVCALPGDPSLLPVRDGHQKFPNAISPKLPNEGEIAPLGGAAALVFQRGPRRAASTAATAHVAKSA
jgi:hypothetical protein